MTPDRWSGVICYFALCQRRAQAGGLLRQLRELGGRQRLRSVGQGGGRAVVYLHQQTVGSGGDRRQRQRRKEK